MVGRLLRYIERHGNPDLTTVARSVWSTGPWESTSEEQMPNEEGRRGGSCSTPKATTRVKARNRTIRDRQISVSEAHLKLWQEWGRSLGLPVHWPLWPAPLPPLVGGLGLANAGPADVRMPAVTSAIAAERNRRFLIENHPLPTS